MLVVLFKELFKNASIELLCLAIFNMLAVNFRDKVVFFRQILAAVSRHAVAVISKHGDFFRTQIKKLFFRLAWTAIQNMLLVHFLAHFKFLNLLGVLFIAANHVEIEVETMPVLENKLRGIQPQN